LRTSCTPSPLSYPKWSELEQKYDAVFLCNHPEEGVEWGRNVSALLSRLLAASLLLPMSRGEKLQGNPLPRHFGAGEGTRGM